MDNAYFVYTWSFLSTITVSCCENDNLMFSVDIQCFQ